MLILVITAEGVGPWDEPAAGLRPGNLARGAGRDVRVHHQAAASARPPPGAPPLRATRRRQHVRRAGRRGRHGDDVPRCFSWLTLFLSQTFFSPHLIEGWAASLDGKIYPYHFFVLASFVASLGIIIGALGASFEEQGYFRHVAYVDEET